MESTLILTLCFTVVLILLLTAAILAVTWAIRQQKILIQTKFEMEKIRESTLDQVTSLLDQTKFQISSFSETSKLLDKSIGLLSSKEPLAYQAIQSMNTVGEPQVVSSEENERRMLGDNSDGVTSLDDPRLAAELAGLI